MALPAVIFRSPTGGVEIPEGVSLPAYVFNRAEVLGSKVAIVDGADGRSYSYAQLKTLVQSVAAGLDALGIRQGDVVMLLLPNCPEYPILFLGIAARGAIVTTVNPTYEAQEIKKQLQDSGAKLIITIEMLAGKVAESNLPLVFLGQAPPGATSVSDLFSADGSKAPEVAIADDDICALPYSSGTTGLSKGVMLTHGNLVANVTQLVGGTTPRINSTTEDVILALLPMFHIYAITAVNMMALKTGATLVTMARFDMEQMLQLAEKYCITIAPVVPPLVLALAKSPLVNKYKWSSLKRVVSGAAPLGAELELVFRKRFPHVAIGQGYGMTESSPTVTLSRALAVEGGPGKPGSAGVLLPNTEAMVVDTASGKLLPANERGELWVRGPQVMKGYLKNPTATAATVDNEGWLHTGDVVFVDEDGEVFVVDRVKELIKYKGFQVPPAELESILVAHPSIADAAVVPKADEEAGEVPVAFVVRAPKTSTSSEELTEEAVQQYVAKQVASYKRLRQVIFVDSIPKSASGKILRRELRSKLQ